MPVLIVPSYLGLAIGAISFECYVAALGHSEALAVD